MSRNIKILIVFALLLAGAGAVIYYTNILQNEKQSTITENQDKQNEDQHKSTEQIIKNRSSLVITALKNKNFAELSEYVHPEKGVRFSPYSHVDTENDVVLTAEGIKTIQAQSRTYMWGRYDGSGKPIEMPFMDYYNEFIYDVDYKNAPQTAYDKIISTGNMIQNVEDVYEDAHHVEYYFPGFDPEYAGMDWRSLRLVFEKYEEKWYLVGIIHNEWTI
jgi:hypothetical protein